MEISAGEMGIEVSGLSKSYFEGGLQQVILDDLSFSVPIGSHLVLLGRSGSGKSTLLNLLSGIDRPDAGIVRIFGEEITALGERKKVLFRRHNIGFVFQFFHLIPTLTACENIQLSAELAGQVRGSGKRAMALLERVGLAGSAAKFPDQLSGGEQQRVAIARALMNEPRLVLADEPTGNLDADTGRNVLSLLREVTIDAGRTLVMATHSSDALSSATLIGRIRQAKLRLEKVPGSIPRVHTE